VLADHLVLGETHDVPVAKELRPHRAVVFSLSSLLGATAFITIIIIIFGST
jgi:hypothetical protein